MILVCLLALAACDTAEERAEKHFKSGMELLQSGDSARALVEFRNVFTLDKNHVPARLAYARASRSMGNLAESYANFLHVADRDPQNMEARLALTEMAIVTQNWDEAERHGAALIAAEVTVEGSEIPKLALRFRQAVLNEDRSAIRDVTREAEALAENDPDNEILHRILIEGYMGDGEVDKAIAITDKAIAASPANRTFYRAKAIILSRKQDPGLLEDHLRTTIELFPKDEETKGLLVQLLAREGDIDGATAFLKNEIETADDKLAAHVTLIAFIQRTSGAKAALAEIDSALPLYENARVLKALQAGLLFDQGEESEAVSVLQAVVDGSEPGKETDQYKITLARMLVSTGNEVGARQLVEAVLESNPSNVDALKMSSAWLIEQDQADEAISSLRRALDQEPEDAETMTLMARAHERNGNAQLAQDLLALAVDASGNAPAETLRFARLLVDQERFRAAEDVLVKSLRRAPGHVGVLGLLGQVYLATEDWSRAEQVAGTLLRQESVAAQDAGNDLKLQVISRVEGRDQGIAFLERMLEGGDENGTAKIALIRARLSQDRPDDALALAAQLVEDFPDNPRARQVLANTQFAAGKVEDAEENLRLVAEETGLGTDILQYARVLGAQGKAEQAEKVIDEGLEKSPDSADLLWAKASYLERNNEIDAAIGIYEQIYAVNSSSLIAANNLASLLATYRDDEESLQRAFSVARRLKGTDVAPFQDTYGWILFRRGQAEEALTYMEPAAIGLKADPIVQYHLGRVYEALDRKADAIAQYEKALELAGTDDPRIQIADADKRKSELSKLVEE